MGVGSRLVTGAVKPPSGHVFRVERARVLDEARRGTLPGSTRTGATLADAAAEFLRYAEHDRGCRPSALRDYRSDLEAHTLPTFGSEALESITPASFSPEKVLALVRAAGSVQEGTIYLAAAFMGLRRGELLALRWRDVDFAGSVIPVRASYAAGRVTTPKSGKVPSVPLAPNVAQALAWLGQRPNWVGHADLVFRGEAGDHLDGSALRRRSTAPLRRAGLRPLRFRDLRHTSGTRMIAKADIRRVQAWMGHADAQTTMRYLHYAPRADDPALVAEAFAVEAPKDVPAEAS